MTIKSKENTMQMYKQNISPLVRKVTENGIDYLIVPMVMMLEQCVMNEVLYTKDVVNASITQWNGRQVVVYHPDSDGAPISANNPTTYINQNIGTILNARVENGKVKAEAWIELVKANSIEEGVKVIKMLEENKNIDVSTGMQVSGYSQNGEYKNNKYTFVTNLIVPDHLAILPDQKGACSWEDGAGFARNSKETALKDKELNNNKELFNMERQKKVSALIESGVIAENQRKSFEEMADGAFDSFESLAKQNAENAKKLKENADAVKKAEDAAKLAENSKVQTVAGLQAELDTVKAEVGEFKANAEKELKAKKQVPIEKILANKDNKITAEQLNDMPIDLLENIASSLKVDCDYSANAGGDSALKENSNARAKEIEAQLNA